MPTFIPKPDSIERKWYVIDARGRVLGRVATAAAAILTGRKETGKVYYRHSGYVGGLKARIARDVRSRHPRRLVEEAVRGMLPKSKLGRAMFHKLKVYAGSDHPHQAQKPQPLNL